MDWAIAMIWGANLKVINFKEYYSVMANNFGHVVQVKVYSHLCENNCMNVQRTLSVM